MQRVTRAGLSRIGGSVIDLARAEGLHAHAESIVVRLGGSAGALSDSRKAKNRTRPKIMMRLQGYPDPGDGLRLHLNENTGGCSPRVLDAIKKMQTTDVSTYPSYPELVRACARHFDVDPDWVLLTNGLDEGILMAAVGHISRARIHDAETIIPLPAFDPYPNSTSAVGATAFEYRQDPEFVFPTDAVIAAVTPRTRMIFLNTPSNPTGQPDPDSGSPPHRGRRASCRRPDRRGLHRVRRHVVSARASQLPECARRAHVLQGIRARRHARRCRHRATGVTRPRACGHSPLQHQRGCNGGNAGGARGPRVSSAIRGTSRGVARAALCRVQRLGLEHWESAANFVMVRVGDTVTQVVEALGRRGVHVRDRSKDPATPGCIRVTAGLLSHTDAAIEALESVMSGRDAR